MVDALAKVHSIQTSETVLHERRGHSLEGAVNSLIMKSSVAHMIIAYRPFFYKYEDRFLCT
uniref:DUS-like FMN-binding domain-containing protein n=1 Tax=Parascaris univalens TaxID=6257 RepID=A0A915B587_PARUN